MWEQGHAPILAEGASGTLVGAGARALSGDGRGALQSLDDSSDLCFGGKSVAPGFIAVVGFRGHDFSLGLLCRHFANGFVGVPQIEPKRVASAGDHRLCHLVPVLSVFISILVWMPKEFNWETIYMGGLVIALWQFWSRGIFIRLAQRLGWYVTPPERLKKIVQATSGQMQVPVKEIWLIRTPVAQVLAIHQLRS